MLNLIWAVMIVLAVIFGACTGRLDQVTNAALDSAGEAISLCITMAGVVALWMGLMEIAQRAGLIEKLTRGIAPFLRFLFPRIPKGHPAEGYIATNIIANVLGLGWACTPAGLKAMGALADLEVQRGNPEYLEDGKAVGNSFADREATGRKRSEMHDDGLGRNGGRRASNEMCTFLILNISSLQLIPVNMIAYRSQYGSARPTAIIAPAIAATLFSSLVAVVYCKVKDHTARNRVYRSYADKGLTGKSHKDKNGIGELTASEVRPLYGRHTGFCQSGSLSEKRKDRGGKAI